MENLKFEKAMEKLEEILSSLEGGNLSLDEALEAYDEALKLVKVCNSRLSDAEARVKMLVKSSDGTVSDCPFDINDAN